MKGVMYLIYLMSSLFHVWGLVTIFPGVHFQLRKPVAVYEATIPLTYVFPHSLYRVPEKSSIPIPKCPFSSLGSKRMAAAAEELDQLIDSQLMRALPQHDWTPVRRARAIEAVGDALHWAFGTATDGELHVLSGNEEAVNKHINSLQEVVKGDHLDLVHTTDEMRQFSGNVTRILGKIRECFFLYIF